MAVGVGHHVGMHVVGIRRSKVKMGVVKLPFGEVVVQDRSEKR